MTPGDDIMAPKDVPSQFVIRLTAPGDPKRVIGYAMAEKVDFVANRDDLLGAAKEALEAVEQSFAREKLFLDALALAPHKDTGSKIFALVGSGKNSVV